MFYGGTEFNKNMNNLKLDSLMIEALEASRQIKEIMKINQPEETLIMNTSKQYNKKNISIRSHAFNIKDIIAKNTRFKLLSFNNYKRTFNLIIRIIK